MKISLTDAGKRFNREWIFRHADLSFSSGNSYAITGPNGSGKSTLLQSIAGMLLLNEGKLTYEGVKDEMIFTQYAFCAPYCDVIEEMTLEEFFDFHSQFKRFLVDDKSMIREIGLEHAAKKQIRYFSSGMKQRVRLAQAVFADTPALLLDEPTSNFDEEGVALYHRLINTYSKDRIVIVCSNEPNEYGFCTSRLEMHQFKGVQMSSAKGHP